MLRSIFLVVIITGLSACADRPETNHSLFSGKLELALPDNYALYERPRFGGVSQDASEKQRVEFVRFGGNEALRRKFPDHPFGETFLDGFAGKDVQANIVVLLAELSPIGQADEWSTREGAMVIPHDATAHSIHERFCQSFSSRWGESGFALFDPDTGVGRCVNFAGAFIAVFTRRVGDYLVIIGGLDFVEALLFEKRGPGKAFLGMTPEEKWQAFRDVANADVAERALLSAKVH